jgi:hypothetical protein
MRRVYCGYYNRRNMREVVDYHKELEKDWLRRRDLKKRKYRALSRYDIEIAAGGNKHQALCTALMLKKNHIKYDMMKLAEQQTPPHRTVRTVESSGVYQQLAMF